MTKIQGLPTGKAPIAPVNHIVVQTEGELKNTRTINNTEFFLDPMFNPEANKIVTGTVVSLPRRIGIEHRIKGNEVQIGDTLFFHYLAMVAPNKIGEIWDNLYQIPYPQAIAIINDEWFTPLSGWCVCKPYYDVETIVLEDGMRVVQSASGIITETNPQPSLKEAVVVENGSPLIGDDDLNLESGDIICYDTHADFDNVGNGIHGERYFYIRHEDLLAKRTVAI